MAYAETYATDAVIVQPRSNHVYLPGVYARGCRLHMAYISSETIVAVQEKSIYSSSTG